MAKEIQGTESETAVVRKNLRAVYMDMAEYAPDLHPVSTGDISVWNKISNSVYHHVAYRSVPFIGRVSYRTHRGTRYLGAGNVPKLIRAVAIDNDIDDDTRGQGIYRIYTKGDNTVDIFRDIHFNINDDEESTSVGDVPSLTMDITGAPKLSTIDVLDFVRYGDKLLINIPRVSIPISLPASSEQTLSIQTLPNWNPLYRGVDLLAGFKQFLIGFNPVIATSGEVVHNRMIWASTTVDSDGYPDWVTKDTNDAGELSLSFIDNEQVVSTAPLNNDLIVYTNRATYRVTFIGGNAVFKVEKIFDDTPVFSRFGAVSYDRYNFVIDNGSIFIHNGVNKQYVATQRVNSYFFKRLHPAGRHKLKCLLAPNNKTIHIFYRSITNPNDTYDEVLVWNWLYNKWGVLNLMSLQIRDVFLGDLSLRSEEDNDLSGANPIDQLQITIDSATFPYDLSSEAVHLNNIYTVEDDLIPAEDDASVDVVSKVFLHSIDPTSDPISGRLQHKERLNASLFKSNISFGSEEETTYIKRIIPHMSISTIQRFQCRLGVSDIVDGAIRWKPWITFDSESDWKIDSRVTGKYVHIEFRNFPGHDTAFSLIGFTIIGGSTGTR